MPGTTAGGIPSTSASGIPREVWSATMQQKLKTKLVAGMICNTRYEDTLMGAKKVRIGLVPRTSLDDLTAVPYDRSVATDRRNATLTTAAGNTSVADVEDIDINFTSNDDRQFTYPQQSVTYYDFDVTQSHKASWRVEKWDGLQTNVEFMSQFTDEKAYDFARIMDRWILKQYAKEVGVPLESDGTSEQTARTIGTAADPVEMYTAGELFDGLIKGIQQLENDNVPREQMWAVVPFEITTSLWQDTRFQRETPMSDQRNISGTHRFGTFEGISIYRSQHLADVYKTAANALHTEGEVASLTKINNHKFGIMGYHDSFTCVVQSPMNFEIFDRLEGYDAIGFRANMLWDGKMLRPDTSVRLVLKTAA